MIGDLARVRVASAPAVVDGRPARDLDEDGRYEDVTGDGRLNVIDVSTLLAVFDRVPSEELPFYDFNDDEQLNILDVAALLGDT